MAVNVPKNYITGKELEELTGIPNLALKAKELMYRPKAEKRQKNIFGDFYRKTLKAKYFDIGQGGRFGTLHYLKPTPNQIKTIREYHLRKGAKYGVTQETADRMKRFYNRPEFRKYIRKGEFIPDEVLKQYGVTQNQAANTTYRLAQALNGKKFANVKIDLPKNKSVAKKLIKKIEQAPFGNPYQLTAYKEAQNVITGELGESYFKNTNFETMKREARRILNREGVPVFDPKKKDSFGFNVNEIIGIKTASRQGLAPYSQFINIMEGKLNTAQYANFVRQFEKFNNRMQTEPNQTKVIKEYDEYRKNFLEKNKGIKDSDLPKISFKTPEEIYGKKRISSLMDQGLDLNKSYEDLGYSIDVGKKTRTLKEFIADPKKISKLKKFGKIGAITGTALSIPAIVQAKEPDDFTSEQVGYNLDSDVDYGDPDTWNLKVGDFLETGAVAAAVAPLATKKGRSIYGKAAGTIARGIGTPLGIGLLTAGLSPEGGYDLSKQEDRIGFEIEAALSKDLVRQSQAFARKIPASRPLLRRATQAALNLGIPGRFATTAARVATPLGLLSLVGEAGLFTYREAMKTKEAIDAMSEEEKQNYLSQQELDALTTEATFASGGRVGFSAGGIAALKALLNFLGKARGRKGSELLQEVNPKKYGTVIENLMLPDDKKMVGRFRVEYLESLLDTIKTDKAMLDRIKKMPADLQESFFNMINQGANQGRLDVYKKINPDEAILEIEQMIKNLKTKDMSPEEIKRSLNAYGGRIGFDNGGVPSIKIFPRARGREVEQEVGPGIKISERDVDYGVTGLIKGDKFFGGAEIDKGKVKLDVITPTGDTLFKDTISKEDAVNFILGMGDPKGDKFQVKTDKDFKNMQIVFKKTFNEGGRVGFDNGGPGDPSRRQFLKILGGLASLPVVGKFFKFVGPAVKKSLENAPTGTPDWFAPLVEKIMKKGVDISDKAATIERQTVKELKTPDGTYTLTQTSDTGEIIVSVDTLAGVNDGAVDFVMTPNRITDIADDGTPIVDRGEFNIIEMRAEGRQVGPDDYDMDIGEYVTNSLDDAASDWHSVEKFATGKTDEIAQQKKQAEKEFIEKNPTEDLLNRYGDYDPPEPELDYD